MINLIKEINSKLKAIISELETKKSECEKVLDDVKSKIDKKIDEAKGYKVDVDNAKEKIKSLEEEIKALEVDLTDLNERFGKKDLNAIVEAGNKEINAKMIAKQNEITKYREKIGELTEKARAIKDLLINLKKDKEIKTERLDNYTKALEYYSKELNRIIDFSSENPENLVIEPTFEVKKYDNVNLDSPVFDEISQMDEPEDEETETSSAVKEEVKTEEEPVSDYQKIDFKALNDSIDSEYASIFGTGLDDDDHKESEPVAPFREEVTEEEPSKDEVKDEPVSNDLNIFEHENVSDGDGSFSFDGLSEADLNAEPEAPLDDNKVEVKDNSLSFESVTPSNDETEELANLFTENGVDYYKFTATDQDRLKSNYNKEMYKKVFDVLKRNNIKLDAIYDSADLFTTSTPAEIEHVISKLLLAGQTTSNISYVLSALPLINSFDLNEVVKSYGPKVSEANITDLIVKAKHLNDLGGNR
ncbi:MAG: coiled-coil domain-containing protein [Bacilli bacterium]